MMGGKGAGVGRGRWPDTVQAKGREEPWPTLQGALQLEWPSESLAKVQMARPHAPTSTI